MSYAYLDNAGIGTASEVYDGSISVTADNRSVIGSGTVSAASSKNTAIAGNDSVNVINNATEAYIKSGSSIYKAGAIAVSAPVNIIKSRTSIHFNFKYILSIYS